EGSLSHEATHHSRRAWIGSGGLAFHRYRFRPVHTRNRQRQADRRKLPPPRFENPIPEPRGIGRRHPGRSRSLPVGESALIKRNERGRQVVRLRRTPAIQQSNKLKEKHMGQPTRKTGGRS